MNADTTKLKNIFICVYLRSSVDFINAHWIISVSKIRHYCQIKPRPVRINNTQNISVYLRSLAD